MDGSSQVTGKLKAAAQTQSKERDYWLSLFDNIPERNLFLLDRRKSNLNKSSVTGSITYPLDQELLENLTSRTGDSDHALHIYLLGALSLLLYLYNPSIDDEKDILIGTPIYRQEHTGEFINTVLPLKLRLSGHLTFKDLLVHVKSRLLEAVEHQNYPVKLLPAQLNLIRSESDEFSLFDVSLWIERIHDPANLNQFNHALRVGFIRSSGEAKLIFDYQSTVFKPETIDRLWQQYSLLLRNALSDMDEKIIDLECQTAEQKRSLLETLNNLEANFPHDKSIHQLYEEQTSKTPDHAALISLEGNQPIVTYNELNRRSNNIAAYLIDQGVTPDSIVPLIFKPGIEMIAAILGVLKAGAAYLPIDSDYPQNRIDYMISDCNAQLLLTQSQVSSVLQDMKSPREKKKPYSDGVSINGDPHLTAGPTSTAYIIYTSGTTGKPKGVMVEHRNVVRLLYNDHFQFDFTDKDVWTLFHSYCFDFSVWEMYGALLYGGKLVIVPHMTRRNPTAFLHILKKEGVTVLNQTPSAFFPLTVEEARYDDSRLNLRYIIFGGEALHPGRLIEWYKKYPQVKLINMFGITETTVHVTYKEITGTEIEEGSSNIGLPIPTLAVRILDRRGHQVPAGVPGRLFVEGEGVARGYLNRPELTAEKFAGRMYDSGDLARVLDYGEMEYLGRIDHQVQLRGFRVETGEIESRLIGHPAIKDCVIVIHTDERENQGLCAYLASVEIDVEKPPLAELRVYLSEYLPEYMIPSYFIWLPEIPLTSNGKVDRSALPEPEIISLDEVKYIEPRTALEEQMAVLWKQSLNLEKVGVTESFFNIGGDSIKAIYLINVINRGLNSNLEIPDLYRFDTIEKLSLRIEQETQMLCHAEQDEFNQLRMTIIEKIEAIKTAFLSNYHEDRTLEDVYPMSDIQRGMVFAYNHNPDAAVYHDQTVFQLSYPGFNPDRFEKAVRLMVQKHSILRTVFYMGKDEDDLQLVYENLDLVVRHQNLSHLDRPSAESYIAGFLSNDRHNRLDISRCLWRLFTFDLGENRILIIFVCHHAILDGWSVASFATELNNIYVTLSKEPGFVPQPLKSNYKDFIIDQMVQKRWTASKEYWMQELDQYQKTDITGPGSNKEHSQTDDRLGLRKYIVMPEPELSNSIHHAAEKFNTSLKHLCFAAYFYMINMLSYENDTVVGLVTNNRPVSEDGDKMLGCFLNSVPFRLIIPPNQTVSRFMDHIQSKLLQLKKYDRLSLYEIARLIGEIPDERNPIFDTIFNFIDFHVYKQAFVEPGVKTTDKDQYTIKSFERTNMSLVLSVSMTGGELGFSFSYDSSLISEASIHRLSSYFQQILNLFIRSKDSLLNKCSILSDKERKDILSYLNNENSNYPEVKTIHQLFQEQTLRTPDHIALTCLSENPNITHYWTYKKLLISSKLISSYLLERGVTPGSIVALILRPGFDMIVAIFGTLLAGAAYLPIDPDYPQDRIDYMLKDSRTQFLLDQTLLTSIRQNTESHLEKGKPRNGGKYLNNLNIKKTTGPAYIIYTSGTTGKPKGVIVEHYNVVRLFFNEHFQFDFSELDVWTLFHSYCFDFSVWEMYGALLFGGRLVTFPRQLSKDPWQYLSVCIDQRVTVLNQTPSAFYQFSETAISNGSKNLGLRWVIFGGEALNPAKLSEWHECYPDVRLVNMFGITETTVHVTYKDITSTEIQKGICNIGTPIPGLKVYILDNQLQLLPIGAAGQLYIGGQGVSRGYLNRPELTSEKFICDPFTSGTRLYASGDLGRMTSTFELEYLGRIDHQVQLRGFRVELGEIENRLLNHEQVKDAVVLALHDEINQLYLCAYIVTVSSDIKDEATSISEQLRKHLLTALPEYMVPSYFVTINSIPLTPNGKVDRRALPAPTIQLNNDYIAPVTETEQRLADIWQTSLKTDKIGVLTNYFSIGGDSIKVIKLLTTINSELDTEITLPDFYQAPTIRELAGLITGNNSSTGNVDELARAAGEIRELKKELVEKYPELAVYEDVYPMSDIEAGMIFVASLNPHSGVYHDQIMHQVDFPYFDELRLKQAACLMANKHSILRTAFNTHDYGEPLQLVYKEFSVDYNHLDLTSLDKKRQEEHVRQFLERDRIASFDMARPLWRLRTFGLDHQRVLIIISCHHAILDGWSVASFFTELNNIYHILESQPDYKPVVLKNSYKDFVIEQRDVKLRTSTREFWIQELDQYRKLQFPVLDLPPKQEQGFRRYNLPYRPDLLEQLLRTAHELNTSIKHVCFAAYAVMLFTPSYDNDFVAGLVTNNRPLCEDSDKILGCFLNSVPVRICFPSDFTAAQCIGLVDEKLKKLKHYDRLSLYEISRLIDNSGDNSNPIFECLFNFIDFHIYDQAALSSESNLDSITTSDARRLEVSSHENTGLPLVLNISATRGMFRISFSYDSSQISPLVVSRYGEYFNRYLDLLINEPTTAILKENIISYTEKQVILEEFNQLQSPYSEDKTLHYIFEEQVSRTPNAIALGCSLDDSLLLSYDRFNQRANRLAGTLHAKGIDSCDIVAIQLPRSIEMMTAIYGILKTGAAYLPIDTAAPPERVKFMLADSNVRFLLRFKNISEPKDEMFENVENIYLDDDLAGPRLDRLPHTSSSNLAYVIYTSGSTGSPKAVAIEHHSVVNRLNWMQRAYPLNELDVIMQKTTYTFDVSVWELFWWCFSGASCCLLEVGGEKNPETIIRTIQDHHVSIMHFVPSMLGAFLEAIEHGDSPHELHSLKRVFASGEKLNIDHLGRFNRYVGIPYNVSLINLYGPTEATVDVSYFDCPRKVELIDSSIPIGKPIDNISLYIVNRDLELLPVGAPGELVIAGAGVARGYLNNPELTAEKFVHCSVPQLDKRNIYPRFFHVVSMHDRENESSNEAVRTVGIVLYRTGDLARWRSDGNIEFLGRIDHQVKIRGFRIELGDIESHLLRLPDVKEAVVMAHTGINGSDQLCAYIVTIDSDKNELDATEIRTSLSQNLPEYMIPSVFIKMETLPLTSSGKVNRKELPDPSEMNSSRKEPYMPPGTIVEKKLVTVWENVLGQSPIGIGDNFFALGGDSIKTIQIISRLNASGYKIDMGDIFNNPTIAGLAKFVRRSKRIADQSPMVGDVPLTPVQKRFFSLGKVDCHYFNQAVMLYSTTGFGETAVRTVFSRIMEHHDALRLTFTFAEGQILQKCNDLSLPLWLHIEDLRNKSDAIKRLEDSIAHIHSGINLEKGPLIKLGLFHLDDGDRLLIVCHHLIIDGVSWRILFEDISDLFNRFEKGEALDLPQKTDSYKKWSQALADYSSALAFDQEKSYWLNILAGNLPTIPLDYLVSGNLVRDIEKLNFKLSEQDTHRLLSEVNHAFNTEINDLLLTALGLAVYETFGLKQVCVELEGHGREEFLDDISISRTVGWFTAIYPILLNMTYDSDLARQIKEVKECLRSIPNKGIGYGIFRYLSEDSRLPEEFPQPQIGFNYLGQFDADVAHRCFQIASESTGPSQSSNREKEYELDISGMLVNRQLHISIAYNRTHFKVETINAFMESFKDRLIRIIGFCSQCDKSESTPSDFTFSGLSIEEIDRLTSIYSVEDIYPLTPMQEGMLYHSLAQRDSSLREFQSNAYFEQMSYRLNGYLDVTAVRDSLDLLFKRHDVLRTLFAYNDLDQPIQIVLTHRVVDFSFEDIVHLPEDQKESFVRSFKEKDRQRSFDLGRDSLMRITLIQVNDNEYEFTWSFHHIIMDGWCIGILHSEFLDFYYNRLVGVDTELSPVQPYRTYIKWLLKQTQDAPRLYWTDYLQGYDRAAGIPRKQNNVGLTAGYWLGHYIFRFPEGQGSALERLAAGYGVTLNTLVQTIWGILLSRYNRKSDVVFGAVVSGRPSEIAGIENMVGLFINTIPVRISFEESHLFCDLLKEVQHDAILAEPHHHYPLAEIQNQTPLKRNLLDHILVFENYPLNEEIEKSGQPAISHDLEKTFTLSNVDIFEQTNYDLSTVIIPGQSLKLKINYNLNAFEPSFIERLTRHLGTLFKQVLEVPETSVARLSILTLEEKEELLISFNQSAIEFPANKSIYQLFEQQAAKTPDHTALIFPGDNILNRRFRSYSTYKELNFRAEKIASYLIEHGVIPGSIVALLLNPGLDTISAILGVLNLGAAYLPIDPQYPQDRIDYILNDSQAQLLIDHARLSSIIQGMDSYYESYESRQPNSSEECLSGSNRVRSTDPAYIIYTSGTTGRPKGVIVEHRSAVNVVSWFARYYELGPGIHIAQMSSYTFDASVNQIFGTLLSGAVLCVIPGDLLTDILGLRQYIVENDIQILYFVPLLLKELLSGANKLGSVRTVISGGDRLDDTFKDEILSKNYRLFNQYGPTETTVDALAAQCGPEPVHLGKPVDNLYCYVLNECELQPIGIPGELCIGGVGVARGYLNRPELTASRFVINPFSDYVAPSTGHHSRLYRTGDLVRWLPGGNIQFLGRMDRQVKIRGYRVEIQEIEAGITTLENVKEVAVAAFESPSGEKALIAYIVPASNADSQSLTDSHLKRALALSLPSYMIPAHFVYMDALPLNANGKVDYRLLPRPGIEEEDNCTPPREGVESKLASIWADVLSIDFSLVKRESDFFDLGGHSLRATVLKAKIHKVFHVDIPYTGIFNSPVLKDQAFLIQGLDINTYEHIHPVEKREYYPQSSAQKRLFFLQRLNPTGTSYNMPIVIKTIGKLHKDKYDDAFLKLIDRHETLRTSFFILDDEPIQRVLDTVEFQVEYKIHSGTHPNESIRQFMQPFDLERAPLMRAGLLELTVTEHLLMFDMHHIIGDGTTGSIIKREFMELYNGGTLEPLRLQYRDYASWQNRMALAGSLENQENYWLNLYKDRVPRLDLSTDFPRPETLRFEGARFVFNLGKTLSRRVRKFTAASGATLFMSLLAAYYVLLNKNSGQEDIVVGCGIMGRPHSDLEKIVGMFVNTLAIRNTPNYHLSWEAFFNSVKSTCLDAFENQMVPFDYLVEHVKLERDPSRNPFFDVLFVVQNYEKQDVHLEEVTFQPYHFENKTSKFDIALFVTESEDDIHLVIEYSTILFKPSSIQKLSEQFIEIINQFLTDPTILLKDIEVSHDLIEPEKVELLDEEGEFNF